MPAAGEVCVLVGDDAAPPGEKGARNCGETAQSSPPPRRAGIMYGPAGGMVTAAGIVERTPMTTTSRSNAPRSYLFTSESVTEGHPDKICDQVSDAILDALLAKEAQLQAEGYVAPSGTPANVDNVRCACETFVTTGTVVVAGEVRTEAYLDVQTIARDVIRRIGYDRAKYGFDCETCGVINMIHEQSPDIAAGVDESSPRTRRTSTCPCRTTWPPAWPSACPPCARTARCPTSARMARPR